MPKIMLVEDDNNLREIYEARLLAEGYEIVSAHDGEEALALAVKEKPDLIISDVMMPKISGFDMLDILRTTPETKNTKVIMMTALSQAEDQDRADKLGADRYLVKSQVTLEDVARVAREVLDGKDTAPVAAAEPTALTAAPTTPAPAVAPVPEPVSTTIPTPAPAADPVAAPAMAAAPAAAPVAAPDPTPPASAASAAPVAPQPVTPVPAAAAPAPTPAAPSPVTAPEPASTAAPTPVASPEAVTESTPEGAASAEEPSAPSEVSPTADAALEAAAAALETVTSTDEEPANSQEVVPPEVEAAPAITEPLAAVAAEPSIAGADTPTKAALELPNPTEQIEEAATTETEQHTVENQIEEFLKNNAIEPEGTSAEASAPEKHDLVLPSSQPTEPVSAAPAPSAPEVTSEPAASPVSTPETTAASPVPAAPATEEKLESADYPESSVAGKKVIRPVSDLNVKPDLNELLAKEQEKEEVAQILGSAGVAPPPPPPPAPGQQAHPDGQDPNLIAL
jgi:CheY-like chemotaxis protein